MTSHGFRTNSKPRVLIAEDLPLIAIDLEQGVADVVDAEIRTVQTLAQLEDALATGRWDLLIAETHLNGRSTAKAVEAACAQDIGVIVCTAEAHPGSVFASLPILVKPHDWAVLSRLLAQRLTETACAANDRTAVLQPRRLETL